MSAQQGAGPNYILGHSEEERQRLERQGAFLRATTQSVFFRAGVRPGMRVLDFGCGVGDTTLLAAELVGPTGEVIGIDRSAAAIEVARARLAPDQANRVRFVQGDEHGIAALAGERKFDALVGRLVLIHQPDTTATLRHLVQFVRPGGAVAFHEVDIEAGHWTSHPNPLLEQMWRWVDGLVERKVFPFGLARGMRRAFDEVGLVNVLVIREGRLVRADEREANAWAASFVRSIAEPARKLGITREHDEPIDALVQRLQADPRSAEALNISAHFVGATGTVP